VKKTILFSLLPFLCISLSGCAPLIIGAAAGGVGAYAASRDIVQGDTDRSYDALWNSAVQVAHIRGTVKQEEPGSGLITLETESGQAWIQLVRLTRATTRLKVSARKFHLPNLDLAQELFTKIMEQAR